MFANDEFLSFLSTVKLAKISSVQKIHVGRVGVLLRCHGYGR